jgi:uncharacterized protein (TIGR01732 family)
LEHENRPHVFSIKIGKRPYILGYLTYLYIWALRYEDDKEVNVMGYYGYGGYGCGYGSGFALIVVLFILLIIVGCVCWG